MTMSEEDEPSLEYIKGYNQGYQLSKHDPELLDKILQAQAKEGDNEYIKAMRHGQGQHQQEKMVAEMKAIRERQKQIIRRKR